jgi:hypothetical protein
MNMSISLNKLYFYSSPSSNASISSSKIGRAILKVDVLIVLIVLIVLSSESFNDIFEANTFIGLGAVYIRYLLPATECAKVLQRGEEEARYRNGND